MLNSLNLHNFRCFSSEQNIPLGRITLIYGPNSSGKSSILKSLVVMKQTLEEASLNTNMITKGQYADIGNFKDFINSHDTKKKYSIKFQFDLTKQKNNRYIRPYYRTNPPKSISKISIEFFYKNSTSQNNVLNNINLYINDELQPFLNIEKTSKKLNTISKFYRIRYSNFQSTKNSNDSPNLYEVKNINWESSFFQEIWKSFIEKSKKEKYIEKITTKMNRLEEALNKENNSIRQRNIFGNYSEKLNEEISAYKKFIKFLNKNNEEMLNEFKEEIKKFYSQNYLIFANIMFWDEASLKEDSLDYFNAMLFKPRNLYHYYDEMNLDLDINHKISNLLYMASNLIQSYFYSTKYLGALRDNPERYYLTTPTVKNYVGKSGKDTIDIIAKDTVLKNKINKQLKNLELGYSITPRKIPNEDIYLFLLKEEQSGITVSLNDVGFGVSQILPILVQSMLSQNETILIEQPEIHIHPKLQAELGTLFAECIKEPYNNNFIIETHSENIILRLQKLIRKRILSSQDVTVIYVDKTEEGSICSHLRLNENGDFIDNWPNGFFEESFEEMFS